MELSWPGMLNRFACEGEKQNERLRIKIQMLLGVGQEIMCVVTMVERKRGGRSIGGD